MIKKSFILIALISLSFNIHSQDTIYIGEFGTQIVPKSQAKFYNVVEKDSLNPDVYNEHQYHLDDTLRRTVNYYKYYSKKKERLTYKGYYKSGKIRMNISYTKGKNDGHLFTYWENGILKRKDLYKMGKFIEGQCWNEKGMPVAYYDLTSNPKFPGGQIALNKYIKSKLDKNKIPKSSLGSKIKISFYIDEDGSVSNVKLLNGADPLTNYEVVKMVIEMPEWVPAAQDGNPVRVKRTLPISL